MLVLSDVSLVLVALGFLAMGIGAFLKPDAVLSQFGVGPLDADGRNEVRAVYGGFGVAIAAALAWGLTDPAMRGAICWTVAIALIGMVAGRLGSMALDKRLSRMPAIYLGIEVLAALLLLAGAG